MHLRADCRSHSTNAAITVTVSVNVCCMTDVAAPTGKDVAVRVLEADPCGFNLEFMPLEVGCHHLKIIYGGQCPVVEPLTVMAYDASTIRVMGVKDGLVGCLPSKFIGTSFLQMDRTITVKNDARFPFKRNRLRCVRCVRCVNENRKKRKR